MTSFPPTGAEIFSIGSEDEQADDVDQTSNDKNGLRQEKINKLVSDGAKNYPAYLKLIYTGESELSSEDETVENRPTRLKLSRLASSEPERTRNHRQAVVKTDMTSSHHASSIGGAHARAVITSPESNKLLDPGREKEATPTDVNDVVCLTPTNDFRSADKFSSTCESGEEKQTTEQWNLELLKIQDDITTLRGMLDAKLHIASDLKRKLGITPFSELKQSVRHFKDTDTYQKTNAAFKHFGVFATKKMANFRQRTSTTVKSVEEPDLYSSDIATEDAYQLMTSKSETNVADYSKKGKARH